MLDIVDNATSTALQIQELIDLLPPYSEVGRKWRSNLQALIPGQEMEATIAYDTVQRMKDYLVANSASLERLESHFSHCDDIRVVLQRLSSQTLELFEIFELKQFLYFYEHIRLILQDEPFLSALMIDFSDLLQYLDPEKQQTPSFHLSDSYSEELTNARMQYKQLVAQMATEKEHYLKEVQRLLPIVEIQEEIVVSRFQTNLVQQIKQSGCYEQSAENFANLQFKLRFPASTLVTDEKIQQTKQLLEKEEAATRTIICNRIREDYLSLLQTFSQIGQLDWLFVRARFAILHHAVIPQIAIKAGMQIQGARHLLLEKHCQSKRIPYQAVDLHFHQSLVIIAGANMSGKTTAIKTAALMAWMTANIIPLPCESAEISLFDFIRYCGENNDSPSLDLSSFGKDVTYLWKQRALPRRGLLVIDEFARGTNPYEGEVLARALLESFTQTDHFVITATHFSAPMMITAAQHFIVAGLAASDIEVIRNLPSAEQKLSALKEKMQYALEEIEPGSQPPKAALLIAELLGFDKEIIARAESYLS